MSKKSKTSKMAIVATILSLLGIAGFLFLASVFGIRALSDEGATIECWNEYRYDLHDPVPWHEWQILVEYDDQPEIEPYDYECKPDHLIERRGHEGEPLDCLEIITITSCHLKDEEGNVITTYEKAREPYIFR